MNGYAQLKTIPNVVAQLSEEHVAANVLINNTRLELRDVRVRQAIAAAIDKASIVRKYIAGSGTVATADLPSFMWGAIRTCARSATIRPTLERSCALRSAPRARMAS